MCHTPLALVLLVLQALLPGCQTPAGSFPSAPTPEIDARLPPAPPPPIVGHWNLDTDGGASEYLWIEPDGTYVEGGAHVSIPPLSDILTDGTWTWSASTLATRDARSGKRTFTAYFPAPDQLLLAAGVSWSFRRAPSDGGAD